MEYVSTNLFKGLTQNLKIHFNNYDKDEKHV
jgi:hypothetical protein